MVMSTGHMSTDIKFNKTDVSQREAICGLLGFSRAEMESKWKDKDYYYVSVLKDEVENYENCKKNSTKIDLCDILIIRALRQYIKKDNKHGEVNVLFSAKGGVSYEFFGAHPFVVNRDYGFDFLFYFADVYTDIEYSPNMLRFEYRINDTDSFDNFVSWLFFIRSEFLFLFKKELSKYQD